MTLQVFFEIIVQYYLDSSLVELFRGSFFNSDSKSDQPIDLTSLINKYHPMLEGSHSVQFQIEHFISC